MSKHLLRVMFGLVTLQSMPFQFAQSSRFRLMHSVPDARVLLQHTMGIVVGAFVCVLTLWQQTAPVFWNAQTAKSSQSLSELDICSEA